MYSFCVTVGALTKQKVYVPVREYPEYNWIGKSQQFLLVWMSNGVQSNLPPCYRAFNRASWKNSEGVGAANWRKDLVSRPGVVQRQCTHRAPR